MIKTLLVFDENDTNLGDFFSLCNEELSVFFSEKNFEHEIIGKNTRFDMLVPIRIKNYEKQNFAFAAFVHGDSDNLLQSGVDPFISIAGDLSLFQNSFFYTFACEAGKTLGLELVNSGCKCFIGYKEKTHIWSGYPKPFVNTSTHGFKLFFEGENTKKIFLNMLSLYNEEIDKLYKEDFVIASILMENRDALVIHGEDTNLSSFEIS